MNRRYHVPDARACQELIENRPKDQRKLLEQAKMSLFLGLDARSSVKFRGVGDQGFSQLLSALSIFIIQNGIHELRKQET